MSLEILTIDPLILFTLFIALAFDFVNGFHDAANAIATVVATRVLTPRLAVVWAAFFNFAAAFFFGTEVAKMVGKDVVDITIVTTSVILAGPIAAIAWNLFTWWLGLPSSSSHALVGGYAGAAFAKAGIDALHMGGILWIVLFIVIAPIFGMALGLFNQVVLSWIVRKQPPTKLIPMFKKLQLVSSAIYSFAHGTNDAQKTMGIIFALMLAATAKSSISASGWGYNPEHADHIPFWIEMACYGMIACGTLFGGFRIVKTMGSKLTKLDSMHGVCAEVAGGVTILGVSWLGIPVSTTHTITGAIVGVGMAGGVRSVRWIVARRIIWAWIFTIPISAIIGFSVYRLLEIIGVAM